MGGGTGGHILPLLAVAHSLRQQNSKIKIIAIADQQSKFAYLLKNSTDIDDLVLIKAGKFRRYPNQSFIQSLLDVKTLGLNIRDGFRTLAGIFQALKILRRIKPEIIFIKGGYVAVPVGISAKLLGIPFITHDSDAVPGLANRIIGRWANLHTVGMSKELYNYSENQTIQVGIPVLNEFKKVTSEIKTRYREQLKIPKNSKVIFITGGSQGAKKLNQIIAEIIEQLLEIKQIFVVHQTGKGGVVNLPKAKNYQVFEYSQELFKYSASADLIITRAGSTIAEFAIQYKPLIVIPAEHLADNHQIKNAEQLKKAKASIVLSESQLFNQPNLLLSEICNLINDTQEQDALSANLAKLYPPNATSKIAEILLEKKDIKN